MANRINCENYLLQNNEPITEQSNPITKNIDLCKSGEQILELLCQTDQEILNGWQITPDSKTDGFINDSQLLNKLLNLAELLSSESNDLMIILTGCGTSGRLAYLYSEKLNQYFNYEIADYIIAGGDYALVNSVESIEDKPHIGCEELQLRLTKYLSKRKIVFIGITCGLSAPFVAGQLDYLLNETIENVIAIILIGFNPVQMTRRTVINTKNETFLDLVNKMLNNPKCFILNPLIGPEPITGSSRMKSGSATKLILDLLLTQFILKHSNHSKQLELLEYYNDLFKLIYSPQTIKSIGSLIDLSAECLRQNGSINYLSSSERLGLLCCVDASECLPTYGAKPTHIRGFVHSNSQSGFMLNCSNSNSNYIVENLNEFSSKNSLFLLIGEDLSPISNLITKSEAQIHRIDISFGLITETSNKIIINGLQQLLLKSTSKINQFFADCLQEMALKIIINSISTGAHVLIGKVYENLMIDVRVSNVKLYKRAISIIAKITGITLEESEQCLLKSIYSNEVINDLDSIEKHIEKATNMDLVVPKALLVTRGIDSNEAFKRLQRNTIRECLLENF